MNKIFIQRLKQCMKEKNLKQIELSRMSNITASSISDWLKGKYTPKQDKLILLANSLEVDAGWLLGITDVKNQNLNNTENNFEESEDLDYLQQNITKIPILGDICAGDGIFCEENFDYYMYVDNNKADFALRVKGDSMIEAGIFDGDIVFIQKKSIVQNGKIAAVLLTEHNEASLKKFYKNSDHVVLQPCNTDYEPIVTRDVLVLGECIGIYREL